MTFSNCSPTVSSNCPNSIITKGTEMGPIRGEIHHPNRQFNHRSNLKFASLPSVLLLVRSRARAGGALSAPQAPGHLTTAQHGKCPAPSSTSGPLKFFFCYRDQYANKSSSVTDNYNFQPPTHSPHMCQTKPCTTWGHPPSLCSELLNSHLLL